HRFVGAAYGHDSLTGQAAQYLGDLKIQEVGRMQSFAMEVNSVLNSLPRSCLKNPVNRGGCIEDDHRASRSSRTNRAVSIFADTGLCLCRRCRNSRSVGLSAISLSSASR